MVDNQEILAEEDVALGFDALIGALSKHKKWALIITVALFGSGVAVILALPNTFRSTATILLEEPEVPQTLVQTTVTVFAAQQIQYINQRVMTRSNLARIIEKFDLYAEKRRYMPTLLLTDQLQANMKLDLINVELIDPNSQRPVPKAIAFTLGFEDGKPEVAQQVVNELVSLYMEENVRSRTVQTVETREFLSGEVDRLDQDVKMLEEQVAAFKTENADSLPEMMVVNQGLSQSAQREIRAIQSRLDGLADTRILLDAQLAQIEPTRAMILPDGKPVVSPQEQLKGLQTRLAMLEGQYSAEHPDVMRTRREIDALRAATGLTADLTETSGLLMDARSELAKAREKYASDHPEIARLERMVDSLIATVKETREANDALIQPDNPPYIQLQAQKETLATEGESLREQQRKLREQLVDYEQRMFKAPAVEQALLALTRELQSATARYFNTRDRQFGAEMGEALETQSKGERFVLVEPANFPLEPVRPNRLMLLALLLFVAPGMGLAWVAFRMMVEQAVWGPNMFASIVGDPPIAEIPLIVTHAEHVSTRRIRIAIAAGMPLVIALMVATVHYALKPLDVLWFVVLRKLGI